VKPAELGEKEQKDNATPTGVDHCLIDRQHKKKQNISVMGNSYRVQIVISSASPSYAGFTGG